MTQITKEFEKKLTKAIAKRDATLLVVMLGSGKKYGRKSERSAGQNDEDVLVAGEHREAKKAGYVDPETYREKGAFLCERIIIRKHA